MDHEQLAAIDPHLDRAQILAVLWDIYPPEREQLSVLALQFRIVSCCEVVAEP